MPFGALPANFGQVVQEPSQVQDAAQIQAEQQKLAKQINMSCVNVTPDGTTAIGFTDLDAKPPVNYYLLVGATAGGWSVVAADYDEEWAQISKDGVTITLKLGKGLIDAPPTPATAVAKNAANAAIAHPAGAPDVPAEAASAPQDPPPPMTVQYARLRAIELAGGPPMPDVSLAEIPKETADQLEKEHQEIRTLRAKGVDVRSYKERLVEKYNQAEIKRQQEEQVKREEMETIARQIAQEELDKNQQAQQTAEAPQ